MIPNPTDFLRILAATVLLASSGSAATVLGNDAEPGKLHELLDDAGRPFDRLEASGVAYYDGRLVVVDDTLNSLYIFGADGRLMGHVGSDELPREKAKFEDITYHRRSETFYAIGSHSGWEQDVLESQSLLLAFRLKGLDAVEPGSAHALPLYRSFEQLGLWKIRGMKIEGLAIDETGESLYIGLREPIDRARIYRVSLRALETAGDRGGSEPAPLEIYAEFDAGLTENTPYCISAMTWDPIRQGLLVATSTEHEPTHEFRGNRLWFVGPDAPPKLVMDRFDVGMKAEGLTLGAGRLFIVYDNDQDDTTIPSKVRVVPQPFRSTE